MFKAKCDEFLSTITTMRSTAIAKAVTDAINKIHTPYVNEVMEATQKVVQEEQKKAEELIASIRKECETKIAGYNSEAKQAIEKHKNSVTEQAKDKAKAEYDTFILGVSQLIDKTNI